MRKNILRHIREAHGSGGEGDLVKNVRSRILENTTVIFTYKHSRVSVDPIRLKVIKIWHVKQYYTVRKNKLIVIQFKTRSNKLK